MFQKKLCAQSGSDLGNGLLQSSLPDFNLSRPGPDRARRFFTDQGHIREFLHRMAQSSKKTFGPQMALDRFISRNRAARSSPARITLSSLPSLN